QVFRSAEHAHVRIHVASKPDDLDGLFTRRARNNEGAGLANPGNIEDVRTRRITVHDSITFTAGAARAFEIDVDDHRFDIPLLQQAGHCLSDWSVSHHYSSID